MLPDELYNLIEREAKLKSFDNLIKLDESIYVSPMFLKIFHQTLEIRKGYSVFNYGLLLPFFESGNFVGIAIETQQKAAILLKGIIFTETHYRKSRIVPWNSWRAGEIITSEIINWFKEHEANRK